MVVLRWMDYGQSPFRIRAESKAATVEAAMELINLAYPDAKLVDSDDCMDGWRVTARSKGGRPGRNVVYINPE